MRIYRISVGEGEEHNVNAVGTNITYNAGPLTVLFSFSDQEGVEYEIPMTPGDQFRMPPGREFSQLRVRKNENDEGITLIEFIAGFGELISADSRKVSKNGVRGYATIYKDVGRIGVPALGVDVARAKAILFYNPVTQAEVAAAGMTGGLAIAEITSLHTSGGAAGSMRFFRGTGVPSSYVPAFFNSAALAGPGWPPLEERNYANSADYSRVHPWVIFDDLGGAGGFDETNAASFLRSYMLTLYYSLGTNLANQESTLDLKFPLVLYPGDWVAAYCSLANTEAIAGLEWNERQF